MAGIIRPIPYKLSQSFVIVKSLLPIRQTRESFIVSFEKDTYYLQGVAVNIHRSSRSSYAPVTFEAIIAVINFADS